MSTTPPALDLDAIRAREQAATRGPWTMDSSWLIRGPGAGRPDDNLIGLCWVSVHDEDRSGEVATANQAFIAHARADVPAMLSALADTQARVATLQAQLDERWDDITEQVREQEMQAHHNREWQLKSALVTLLTGAEQRYQSHVDVAIICRAALGVAVPDDDRPPALTPHTGTVTGYRTGMAGGTGGTGDA